ncbi:PHP domain-containing protein [Chloroflexota bacterium]
MKADLHLHTTASDGKLSPEELVRRAEEMGLSVIAITDHDSVSGIPSALEVAKSSNLLVIPAVEISTDVPNGEVHILGYFIDYRHPELSHALERLRASRYERGRKMVDKLREMGIHIEWGRVLELASDGSIGRPHIVQAMLERGYISTFKEAFTSYIGRNGPAYVERRKITPIEAIALVLKANGLPVLAHPAEIEQLVPLIQQLKKAGLVGIEVYYNCYSLNTIAYLKALAEEYNLVTCGGSDYHGLSGAGGEMGNTGLPQEAIEQLVTLARSKQEGNKLER